MQIKSEDKKIIVVVFIGGVTFAEISALRYLSELNESKKKILLARV